MFQDKTSTHTNQVENPFILKAAEWAASAIGGKFEEPPAVPTGYKNGFFDGRGIFHELFQAVPKLTDPVDGEDNRRDAVIESLIALNLVNEKAFDETVKALTGAGWCDAEIIREMIDDGVEVEDSIFGNDDFDGQHSQWIETNIVQMPESVASADKPEPTKKEPDRFAKLHDWVMRLPVSLPRRVLLAELMRAGCGRVFTWAGNGSLAAALGVLPRQVQKQLKALEKDGYITIRRYSKSWCKTQRLIFVNRMAELAGIDPMLELPLTYKELMIATASVKPKAKPKKQKLRTASLKSTKSHIGCPVGRSEDVQEDTRRDNDSGLSLKRQNPEYGDAVRDTFRPEGGVPVRPAVLTEAELVEQAKRDKSTSRPAIDWAEKNLPLANAEPELAKIVRRGQITHIHPQWLKGRNCWMVRVNRLSETPVYMTPKITHDGWFQVTTDSAIVPLINSENRMVNQAKFAQLIQAGMKSPDITQPVKTSAD